MFLENKCWNCKGWNWNWKKKLIGKIQFIWIIDKLKKEKESRYSKNIFVLYFFFYFILLFSRENVFMRSEHFPQEFLASYSLYFNCSLRFVVWIFIIWIYISWNSTFGNYTKQRKFLCVLKIYILRVFTESHFNLPLDFEGLQWDYRLFVEN